jgi:folate-binding protein YgfZ
MNSIQSEYKLPTADDHNSITSLSFLGLLKVSGEGAKKLLQGQLTCQLDDISSSYSSLGAQCNPQGRMISFFRLFFLNDAYYLQMPLEILTHTQAALQKYAPFYKVTLTTTDELAKYSVYGLQNEAILMQLYNQLPAEINSIIAINGLSICKLPGLLPHYELLGNPDVVNQLDSLINTITTDDALNTWKKINITAGIPDIYSQTTLAFVPHDLNLQLINAISFSKGCYTGQEIIARMHYKGQLKKHMYLTKATTELTPTINADIHTHSTVAGKLVDYYREANGDYYCLIIANANDVLTNQLYLLPNQNSPLQILKLPYTFDKQE